MHVCHNIRDLPYAAELRDKPGYFQKHQNRLWKSRNLTVFYWIHIFHQIIFNISKWKCEESHMCGFEQGENHNLVLNTTLRSRPDEQTSITHRYELHCSKLDLDLKFLEDHVFRLSFLKNWVCGLSVDLAGSTSLFIVRDLLIEVMGRSHLG